MRITIPTIAGAALLAAALSQPAFAGGRGGGGGGGGGHGGDREPAGGAFMSSYPEPGSTGTQAYGPPRSVDFPRPQYPFASPETTGSINPVPRTGYYYPR